MSTTFRKPLKGLPPVRDCAVCAGRYATREDVKQHNLDAASHGERKYPNPNRSGGQ